MKTSILLSIILASCNFAHAQDKAIQLEPTVYLVVTDEPCADNNLKIAYAVETVNEEYAIGCWYRLNGEIIARLPNGAKFQDYRYLESEFKAIK